MNEDGLKLTTYFGERDRLEDRFLADALMDVYGRHELQASVLLRGVEGFGLEHHLRTDRLLTLSEDLPIVSVAVDARARIEAVLGELMALERTGLVTLERARMLSGTIDPVRPPEEQDETTRLTIYVGRRERVDGVAGFAALTGLLQQRGLAGATVLLGVDGTAHGVRQRARLLGRNADVPMMIIAVGDGPTVARVLPELGGLLARPLLTLERVRLCKRDGELLAAAHERPATDRDGRAIWQKLMIYSSEQAHYDRRPLHQALVRRLRRGGVAGATVLRGIWGFHGDKPPHGDKLVQVRRHAPIVTIVLDTPPRIAQAFTIVDEVTRHHGLVTSEMVPSLTARSRDRGR